MQRLTPSVIMPAIERANKKISGGCFIEFGPDDQICGLCPIAALVMASEGEEGLRKVHESAEAYTGWLSKNRGLSQDYVWGFISGIDFGYSSSAMKEEDRRLGFKDGLEVRKAIKSSGLQKDRRFS